MMSVYEVIQYQMRDGVHTLYKRDFTPPSDWTITAELSSCHHRGRILALRPDFSKTELFTVTWWRSKEDFDVRNREAIVYRDTLRGDQLPSFNAGVVGDDSFKPRLESIVDIFVPK